MTPASTNSGHRPPAAEPSPSTGTTSDRLNNPAQGARGKNTVEVDDIMSENRWNARQFAKAVQANRHLNGDSPRLVWVTSDALHRAFEAVRNGALEPLQVPLPTEPLVIGLESPVQWTPTTPSTNLISVHPVPDLRREAERHRAHRAAMARARARTSVHADRRYLRRVRPRRSGAMDSRGLQRGC